MKLITLLNQINLDNNILNQYNLDSYVGFSAIARHKGYYDLTAILGDITLTERITFAEALNLLKNKSKREQHDSKAKKPS